ncbi:MAG: glycosyltransferase family 2 protein [Clostridia bacterium]|nr:glycosyltransferase family 2 protein [Clostridia bacterium]
MKFSIIVPVYNAEKYLSECVGSVLRQTFSDYELILVDDGSGRVCADLCDALSSEHERIRVIHQCNSGQLYARVAGIENAAGEYIIFLDADDILLPECLQKLAEASQRTDGPEMMIYSFFRQEQNGVRTEPSFLFEHEYVFRGKEKNALYELFFNGSGLNNVWTKAVRKDVFLRPHPDYSNFSHLRCAEDRVQSMIAVSNAASVAYLPQRLYVYRLTPGSVTREFSPESVGRFDMKAVYPLEIACLKEWNLFSDSSLEKLNASYIIHSEYVLDLFYKNIHNKDGRAELLSYPWPDLVPKECAEGYENNAFLSERQKLLFTMMLRDDRHRIKAYLDRKIMKKAARRFFRRLIG